MRILYVALVENDVSLNRAYTRVLRAMHCAVDSYLSAESLLAQQAAVPDCFVLDIDLGGMSGLALHARLRAGGIDAPVIFITGGDSAADTAQAWAGGCHALLRKPFSAAELQAAILAATA